MALGEKRNLTEERNVSNSSITINELNLPVKRYMLGQNKILCVFKTLVFKSVALFLKAVRKSV